MNQHPRRRKPLKIGRPSRKKRPGPRAVEDRSAIMSAVYDPVNRVRPSSLVHVRCFPSNPFSIDAGLASPERTGIERLFSRGLSGCERSLACPFGRSGRGALRLLPVSFVPTTESHSSVRRQVGVSRRAGRQMRPRHYRSAESKHHHRVSGAPNFRLACSKAHGTHAHGIVPPR